MIRKFLIAALLTVMSSPASAGLIPGLKIVEFGLKAGVTSSNLHIFNSGQSGSQLLSDPRTGFHFGVMARVNLPGVHIQPEVLYSMNKYKLTVPDGATLGTSTVKYNSIDVPVLAGLRLLFLRIQAGPVFTVANFSSVSGNAGAPQVTVNKPSVSYAVGVGLDIFGVNLDVRYNGKFSRGDQSIKIGDNQSFDYKTGFQGWMFSIGYMF
jgi:hypothetical protein